MLAQRLRFGSKHQASIVEQIVEERFLADTVTRKKQPASRSVPEGESKHAIEATEAAHVPCLVGLQDDFSIAVGAKLHALRLQFTSDLPEVVDLPVVCDHKMSTVVEKWLIIVSRDIDNRQPPMPEDNRAKID